MAETLSRDEVDALLKGMAEGDVAVAEGSSPPGGVQAYELVRDRRVVDADGAQLALVHDRFARELTKSVGAFLLAEPAVQCGDREVLTFGAFRERIPPGASLWWLRSERGEGRGLAVIAPALAFELVDRIFGGPGRVPPNAAERVYSSTEVQTIRRLAQCLLDGLTAAAKPVADVRCALDRTADPAAELALFDVEEIVLVIGLECDLGSGPGRIAIALPRDVLAALSGTAGAEGPVSDGASPADWSRAMRAAVYGTEVAVTAELGRRELPARDILRLGVGDVLSLPTRGGDPLLVRVEGRPLLRGVAGVSHGQNAIRIMGFDGGEE